MGFVSDAESSQEVARQAACPDYRTATPDPLNRDLPDESLAPLDQGLMEPNTAVPFSLASSHKRDLTCYLELTHRLSKR